MLTDPIADMLIRIKNAVMRKKDRVSVPYSKMKERIADILKKEGFITDYKVEGEGVKKNIDIYLKYDEQGEPIINDVRKISKPGRRIYVSKDEVPWVKTGMGIAILSTSKGIVTDREARRLKIGGELICEVW
jgi:small subunit ribosomal protein S8